ncbi:hypothetical protein Gorai_021861 [Gossypium raimondii]|uniref:Uncharacterized protein n=1 Tax=Gossypium raimondii TaxID=29730 RepID=A0A7J8NRY7_GOSRA|nr:hypothetical protein [Gossypium raimondii]
MYTAFKSSTMRNGLVLNRCPMLSWLTLATSYRL